MQCLLRTQTHGALVPEWVEFFSKCKICGEDWSHDHVSHIAQCKALKKLANLHLGLCRVYDKQQFFNVANETASVVGRRAIHLFAAKKAYDSCRNANNFDKYGKQYQAALIGLFAQNQCKNLLIKSLLFRAGSADPPDARRSTQTVLPAIWRARL